MSSQKTLFEIMTENLHEVRLEQIRPGMDVFSGHSRQFVYTPRVDPATLGAWVARGEGGGRFFVADPPAPSEEYAPGTFARITAGGREHHAIRVFRIAGECPRWADQTGFLWNDWDVSHVEVLALPDGTRPVPKITKKDVEPLVRNVMSGEGKTIEGIVQDFVRDLLTRKFGSQA